MEKITGKQWIAFISYQKKDAEWAEWLQHQLEHYHLPTNIIDNNTSLPKELRPIFRDDTDLSSGFLTLEIKKALENSNYLIVVCSPNSAKSFWVNQEVQTFIEWGRTKEIIPFIVSGTPYSEEEAEECFTPALRSLKGSEQELLGINVSSLGREVASVKVVARMLNLRFDILWNRYEREKEEEKQKLIETNRKIKRNLARFVAEKASELVDKGDAYTARLLALEVLPTPSNADFPYTPEAEFALRKSMRHDSAILRDLPQPIKCATISPDNNYIVAVAGDHTTKIWNAHNGQLIPGPEFFNYPPEWQTIFYFPFTTFLPDSNIILYPKMEPLYPHQGKYFTNILEMWDITECQKSGEIKYPNNLNHSEAVNCANFSPTGDKIVISNPRRIFNVWDLKKGKVTLTFGYYEPVRWRTDPITLEKTIVHDDEEDKTTHNSRVLHVEFSPDGKRIVSASIDNTARIWSAITGRQLCILKGHEDGVYSARFSPDSKHVVTVSKDGNAMVWSVKKGRAVNVLTDERRYLQTASYHPQDPKIITALSDFNIAIWDARKGKIIDELKGHTDNINSACFSPDGRWIVSASDDHTVRLWGTKHEKELFTLYGHRKYVKHILFSPDGNRLASWSADWTTKIWDIKKRMLEKTIGCYVFSPDWTSLVEISYKTIKKIGVDDNKVHWQSSFDWFINSANFSYDGLKIVVILSDGDIKILDAENGQE